ncbi:hypothetical protein KK137_05655 [Croceibacterium sp. LX-88]|uniref:PsiF repeat-containing protein n=1 Tax=Croceibacterium selenioxidans TaxID=2838833 RepID=A0ABS5W297_9SPHN|nr:hypothetical protein [Croceibacterium selenioxidans]MBT2133814.1 hypothetical protein [Croceibacterium selenioxidans]
MKGFWISAAALAALTTVSVSAQEQQAEQAKEEKKICRSEKMTGSLTRTTRICLTAAQWRELTNRTKKGLDEMQGSASGGQRIYDNPGA